MDTTRHVLPTLDDTNALAQTHAAQAKRGDVYLLSGELGVGKSSFARAFIRAYFNAPDLDVPSPTYTLIQTYDNKEDCPVHHLDLYRLGDESEVEELGLEFETAITLIEWPERLPENALPSQFVRIRFSIKDSSHIADISYFS